MAERLADATSPYLLQHAGNPVDWWQWSDEAFEEARRRDVPVLLSIGYSACHWCHVMAHESFEDQATADLMNARLVSIKVDREERPDVDAVYMTATQAMTGQGGWPMTAFLTPDREPFYCGTYYPRDHFNRLIQAIADAWQDRRGDVTGQARQIAEALAETSAKGAASAGAALTGVAELTDAAVTALTRRYDSARGGFGGAPKFPPSTVLEFLLRRSERISGDGGEQALAMAAGTLKAMARGGIYDQIGGGFARYSVDADWVVPHFEKMLYDNAQLAGLYAHWWRRAGGDEGDNGGLARRIAEQTCDWIIADLTTSQGGFASALDADSDGTEGAFYVWTPADLATCSALTMLPTRRKYSLSLMPAPSSMVARSCASWRIHPTGRGTSGSGRCCWRPGSGEPGRPGTTRWSRRGTAWRSGLWPRPGCCSAGPTMCARPAGPLS